MVLAGHLSRKAKDIDELINKNVQLAHITLFTAEGVAPIYSNELLLRAEADGTLESLSEVVAVRMKVGFMLLTRTEIPGGFINNYEKFQQSI